MADKYYGFIYLWENSHPEAVIYKKYIGQHIGTIEDGYIGSGVIFTRKFYSKKYRGYWKRTILEKCANLEDLNSAEKKWITSFNATLDKEFCNIREGGKNSKLHPDTIRKISKKLKGRIPPNKGQKGLVKLSDRTKQKIQLGRNKFYQSIFERDNKKLINYLHNNRWFKAIEVPGILNKNVTTSVTRHRIKQLVNYNKIKHVWFGANDRRYVPCGFSFKNDFVCFLKGKTDVDIKRLVKYFTKYYNINETMVRTLIKNLQKTGVVKQRRGYRINYYYV
jgi:hypothetical protein